MDRTEGFDPFKCPVCGTADGLAIRGNRTEGMVVIGDARARGGGLVVCQACQAVIPWGVVPSQR